MLTRSQTIDVVDEILIEQAGKCEDLQKSPLNGPIREIVARTSRETGISLITIKAKNVSGKR